MCHAEVPIVPGRDMAFSGAGSLQTRGASSAADQSAPSLLFAQTLQPAGDKRMFHNRFIQDKAEWLLQFLPLPEADLQVKPV
jgi:hypothetical protein